MSSPLKPVAVIFGGGAAGLWLLAELTRAGYGTLLLEAHELGSGQTIASQGIIHGGLKYTLSGLLTPSAQAIRDMPLIWRRCLAGEAEPDLSGTRLRAAFCHLWRTTSLRSRLAMIGARAGLRITPKTLTASERPASLANCPGVVARVDEQVIEPASLISELSHRYRDRILKIDVQNGLEFSRRGPSAAPLIRLINPETGEPLDIEPAHVILTAGAGNESLAKSLALKIHPMQRRPLHMVMTRGELPPLHGHCVDGAATRATITSTKDFSNRTVWQIGGNVAEAGICMQPPELIAFAAAELKSILPGLRLNGVEWATYRVDRAEPATGGGARPENAFVERIDDVIIAWPTKLALVPEMSRLVMREIVDRAKPEAADLSLGNLTDWPRPIVALPPWEIQQQWFAGD